MQGHRLFGQHGQLTIRYQQGASCVSMTFLITTEDGQTAQPVRTPEGKLSTSPMLGLPRLSNRFLRWVDFITRFILGIVQWKTNSFVDLIFCKYALFSVVRFLFVVCRFLNNYTTE